MNSYDELARICDESLKLNEKLIEDNKKGTALVHTLFTEKKKFSDVFMKISEIAIHSYWKSDEIGAIADKECMAEGLKKIHDICVEFIKEDVKNLAK